MRPRHSLPPPSLLSTVLLLVLLASPLPSAAFYLPGAAPTNYASGDKVPLQVNSLTPADINGNQQVHSVYSFDYYHPAFHFCKPADGPKWISESLGSILFGDRIQTSPFELKMGVNESCKAVCEPQTFEEENAVFVNQRIRQGYDINWLIDGLPAGRMMRDLQTDTSYESTGFPLGKGVDGRPVLHNHYDILVEYHRAGKDSFRVVGIEVDPYSRANSKSLPDGKAECGDDTKPLELQESGKTEVLYTYGVYWRESPTSFATRWDKYLHVYDPRIHWFSLINSAVIVLFLVGMVSTILIRTLRKDFVRYNRLDIAMDDLNGGDAEDGGVQEDSGWKLVHGDVFRPPRNPMLLSILVGNGAQLFMMAGFTIAFALLGFLSPSSRGFLGTVMIILYTLFGFIGGYTSARVYKFFGGDAWKQNFVLTPVALPGLVFGVFFLLNLFVWARKASGAVPFSTMLLLVLLWFVISLPLSLTGSWLGFKARAAEPPTRTNQIPRQVPPSQGYMRPLPSMLLAGVLPFGAIFVELYFILKSIWFSKVYYMFGFLFVCFGLMVVTSAAITVLMIYFLLCAENYHWQWRAFGTAGASAVYVFLYAMIYWVKDLSFTSWTSGVLYLGYSLLISFLFFVLTGTIGFFAAWLFVLKIYASIKVD